MSNYEVLRSDQLPSGGWVSLNRPINSGGRGAAYTVNWVSHSGGKRKWSEFSKLARAERFYQQLLTDPKLPRPGWRGPHH